MSDVFMENVRDAMDDLDSLSGEQIAISASWAFVRVLKQAAVAAAIGGIKREVGGYVRKSGQEIVTRVGLLAIPVRGQRGPHGVFLELGTKYIVARHMISIAMDVALSRAMDAASSAAEKKINSLLRKGKS